MTLQLLYFQNGQMVLDQGYGVRSLATREPLESNTIEQLLQMTSGIPDHINDVPGSVKIISSSQGDLNAALALVKNMPLNFKPGTQSVYCNTNYLLLGTIVARVSHMPYSAR